MTTTKLNWAIWATGGIAHALAEAIQFVDKEQLIAVGSRTQKNADMFAKKYHLRNSYEGLDRLLADEEVDVVYIATPHMFHYAEAKKVLAAGKHLLCEKAFTVNAKQAEELILLAKQKKVFLMEAMWTRFQPLHQQIKTLIEQNILGEITYAKFDFFIGFEFTPEHRLVKKELAGGGLLDLGIYCLSTAQFYLGDYSHLMHTHATMNAQETDQMGYVGVKYPNGAIADLHFGMELPHHCQMILRGEKGYISIDGIFHLASQATLKLYGEPERLLDFPYLGNGYPHEVLAFNEQVNKGQLESEQMPLAQTLTLMKQMDEIRSIWGLTYPGE